MYIQWNITQLQEEWNLTISNDVDGARMYYAKWICQSEKDKYMISLVEFKKKMKMREGGRKEKSGNKPHEAPNVRGKNWRLMVGYGWALR